MHVRVKVNGAGAGAGNETGDMPHVARDERVRQQGSEARIRRVVVVLLQYSAGVGAEKRARRQLNLGTS